MRMTGMDGIEFLKKVKEVSPASVRMMLTATRTFRRLSTRSITEASSNL
jgi:response regulator RpfG family c-di-GMP phosphodiesterase